jgi:DNA-binding IscR family transcriptional regulator
MRFVEGPFQPVSCITGRTEQRCSLHGECVFLEVWDEARKAMTDVLDRTTLQDLIKRSKQKGPYVASYHI